MNNRIILKRTPQSECFEVMINESSLISWINLYEMNNNPTSIEATIFSSIQLQCKQENILPESIVTSATCFRGKTNLGYWRMLQKGIILSSWNECDSGEIGLTFRDICIGQRTMRSGHRSATFQINCYCGYDSHIMFCVRSVRMFCKSTFCTKSRTV